MGARTSPTPASPRTQENAAPPLGVELEGVRVRFASAAGPVLAVDGVSLAVQPGEFVALLGPSGCGKSTLLRVIAGLQGVSEGQVRLTHRHRLRKDIAFVFQDASLLPWRNTLRNVALPLELMGVPRGERLDAARAALERVGLSDSLRRYPAQLSGGMRMRCSLARALVTDPKLLLLDEPFAALDEITRQRLDEMLRELWRERRMTTLFVTHSISEAVYLANRAVVFSRRPARTLLDTAIELPEQRPAELRTSLAFAEQSKRLFEVLRSADEGEDGGS